jgi:hypothetical protein
MRRTTTNFLNKLGIAPRINFTCINLNLLKPHFINDDRQWMRSDKKAHFKMEL